MYDNAEYETAHTDFCADGGSADKLSRKIRDLIENNVRICSSSGLDYNLNSWDNVWQNVIAELTAFQDALRRKDTAGILLHEHLLAYPEMLDSIQKIKHLPDLDWESIEPKKGCRKKLLAKHWLNKRAYDKLINTVDTLLKPVKVPELIPINQASTKKNAQDDNASTNGVWMGVELTATVVHPATAVFTQVPGNGKLPKLSWLPMPTSSGCMP